MENERLETENNSLKSQVNYAQVQMNKLLDENKEMEIRMNELKAEKELLQNKATDPSDFVNWTHVEILSWIISIDQGYFEKYRSILERELKDCDMKGSDLSLLNSNDIRGLGVKVFHDAKKLERYIQEFVQQQSNVDQNLIVNEGASTAFLHK